VRVAEGFQSRGVRGPQSDPGGAARPPLRPARLTPLRRGGHRALLPKRGFGCSGEEAAPQRAAQLHACAPRRAAAIPARAGRAPQAPRPAPSTAHPPGRAPSASAPRASIPAPPRPAPAPRTRPPRSGWAPGAQRPGRTAQVRAAPVRPELGVWASAPRPAACRRPGTRPHPRPKAGPGRTGHGREGRGPGRSPSPAPPGKPQAESRPGVAWALSRRRPVINSSRSLPPVTRT
jgi:translation initiation factor IF-2